MITSTSIKVTSILQIIYCLYCITSTLLIVIGVNNGPLIIANLMLFLFYTVTAYSIIIAPVCFLINLVFFLLECKDPEQKRLIGKKWIWIFVWPVISTVCYMIACLPFC